MTAREIKKHVENQGENSKFLLHWSHERMMCEQILEDGSTIGNRNHNEEGHGLNLVMEFYMI